MSADMPHMVGDGRLDTLLENQFDPTAYPLGTDLFKSFTVGQYQQTQPSFTVMACALLTKLQYSCISQLGVIII